MSVDSPVLAGQKIDVGSEPAVAGPGVIRIGPVFQSVKNGILKKTNDLIWVDSRQRKVSYRFSV